MKKSILTALSVLAGAGALACSTVATLGTDSTTALKELRAVYAARDELYASKDTAGVAKYHAPNLTAKLADGTRIDRAQFESMLEKKMQESAAAGGTQITELAQEETAFVAVVTPGLGGQGSALRETWKKTGDGWKLKSVEELPQQSAIASGKNEKKRPS